MHYSVKKMDLKNSNIKLQIFQHYSKINYADYYNVSRETFTLGRGKRKKSYIPLAVSFDIETTSTVIDEHNVAWCYHWQIGIDDDCFYGRNLQEVVGVFENLSMLAGEKNIICWIHNLSYEFGFLIEYMKFENVFAKAPNKPLKCDWKNIEFRCSYAFSNMSLALLSETYTDTKKGVGDLDYNVIRYPTTPLTVKEKLYCYKDVKILTEYVKKHIFPTYITGKKRKWLPLTNTAKVRHDMQSRISNWLEYKKLYDSVYPSEYIYERLRLCFYGGIVRANAYYFSKDLNDVASRDRTSSYPAVQFDYKYPMGLFYKIPVKDVDKYSKDEYAKMLHVEFINLKCLAPVSIMPYDKAKTSSDRILDNGRIYSASCVDIWTTDIDFEMWKKFYTGQVRILECYISKKGRLCRFQIESLFDYYLGKKKYKHVSGKEEIYLKSKNMLNSNFGCCVQKHNDENNIFDFDSMEWTKTGVPYQVGKSEFLLYQVGVWITAYARYELLRAVYMIWKDDEKHNREESSIVYMDTDSCKYRFRDGELEYIFEKLDKDIQEKTKMACEHYNINFSDIEEIGTWELESEKKETGTKTYKSFITLGSKRYLTNGVPTISGLPKKGFESYCKNHNVTPQEAFTCGTNFTEKDIEKLSMQYLTNQPQHDIIMDNGETFTTPKNYIYAKRVCFVLDISKDYDKFIKNIATQTGERGECYNEE